VKIANYETQHYVIVSILVLLPFSWIKILSSTLHFTDILNACHFLIMRDEVSHPYRETCNITVLCFNLYIFREETGRQKILKSTVTNIP